MSEKETTQPPRPRVLSGVQPTGKLHIGNYVGALSVWVENQAQFENLFCVVDLHALTIPEAVDPNVLRKKNREVAALYLASGIDPAQSTVFIQSEVAEHAELCWILTCVTPLGWLHRMTQFKSKGGDGDSVGTGLLAYPVLQAADILIYQADQVPVGEDQKQHIELARDIAQRFNSLFGETFNLPQPMIRKSGARIMAFDDPTKKMSKSLGEISAGHSIGVLDPPKQIRKTIMRAVTDSGSEVDPDNASPGVINLMTLYRVLSGQSEEAVTNRFAGQGYGTLKKDVAEAVLATLEPVQERWHQLMEDEAYLDGILSDGADRARSLAQQTLSKVKQVVGLGR